MHELAPCSYMMWPVLPGLVEVFRQALQVPGNIEI